MHLNIKFFDKSFISGCIYHITHDSHTCVNYGTQLLFRPIPGQQLYLQSILKENNKILHLKTISHSVRALQMIKKVIHQFLPFSTSINFVGFKWMLNFKKREKTDRKSYLNEKSRISPKNFFGLLTIFRKISLKKILTNILFNFVFSKVN